MGVLPDWMIRQRTLLSEGHPHRLVIEPYSEGVREPGVVSYGLSSYGYDIRLGRNYLIFSDVAATEIDPITLATTIEEKKREGRFAEFLDRDYAIIPPNSFCLAESLEYVEIPRDCIAMVLGKSTWARCGCNLNMTPLEPEWKGVITIEIINATRLPLRVHSGHGIGQMLFFRGEAACERSYQDKKGLYQDQQGLTLPRA
jgi:dCTP deaminase